MIYKTTKTFPKEELYSLVLQMRRCAVSITSNIAEGFSRQTQKEKKQFYYTALGSITELQNQLLLSRDVGCLSQIDFSLIAKQSVVVSKLMAGLVKSAKGISQSRDLDIQNTKYKIQNTFPQAGQALLVVLLVMVVVSTIALSLLSRTTTDVAISRQEEESARAFSAAEAGIEEALRTGIGASSTSISTGVSFTSTVKTAGQKTFAFSKVVSPGEAVVLWLNGHDTTSGDFIESSPYGGSSFDLCWQGEPATTFVAMEVTVYYKDGTEYKVARGAYDSQSRGNGFDAVDSGSCMGLAHKKNINLSSLGVRGTVLFAMLKPYYGSAKIAVEAPVDLSSQGREIESIGSVGNIQRKVKVFRSWPQPAAVFNYGLFSGSGLSKGE